MSTDPLVREQYNSEQAGEIVSLSSPRLSAIEKLYVRVYLNTLSHSKAYESVKPNLKNYPADNQFSRKDNIQFHISLGLQDKADAFGLDANTIIERLYKEATREGAGSNHAARITALTQLGKHFGLFQEKKESNNHTFNIVNYGTIDSLEQLEPLTLLEPQEEKEVNDLPKEVVLTDYTQ